ncbi:MAG: SUMF1/EgtB/PvdO family nonheme iron enzyme [Caldilineaceae bacterium]|nr:SUMF1/EgtB/PvdO family nonheme iron enzyme [Caldilineaceae bacterium]
MAINEYTNFDLLILPAGDSGYQARVARSPVGQAVGLFTLPFAQEDLHRFFWVAGIALRKLRLVAEPAPAPLTPQQFGARLFDAVFAGQVGQCFLRSLDAAAREEKGLRIRLFLNDAPELASLPWEYLYAATPKPGFLTLSDATPIVRYLELQQEEKPLKVLPPLRLLAVVSNPQDVTPLDVEKEWARLQDALTGLQSRQLIRLERLDPPTPVALQRRLREAAAGAVHILHFIGHGAYDEERQEGGLYFEDDEHKHHFLAASNLAILLQDHTALRMVFLNACEGARGGSEDLFAGAAQTLVQQGVPAVLAMQFPVGDAAATALCQEFYQALALGMPVDACVGEARKVIKAGGNELEWGTPVLFSRSTDNRIMVLPEGDARPVISRQPWEPETVLIPGGPFLMGSADPAAPPAEQPQHVVDLPDFRIGKYPVTVREYAEFVKETKAVEWANSARGLGWINLKPPTAKLDHPVTGVSWYDALAYCAWLSGKTDRHYQLPSEAEWEKAASNIDYSRAAPPALTEGAAANKYPWGGKWIDGRCNVAGSDTMAVTAHTTGASTYGVEDLLGNVQEWTRSLWGSQPAQPEFGYLYDPDDKNREVTAPAQLPAQARLVHRGGDYQKRPADVRCTARGNTIPTSRLPWRGFRVVMVLQQDE